MYAAESMPKDQTFKLRLDAEDRKRLERVAEHYSLPVASLLRMLVKREDDALAREAAKAAAPKKSRGRR